MRDDAEAPALALYQALRARGAASSQDELRRSAGLDREDAERGMRWLRELGLVRDEADGLEAVDPDTALTGTMDAYHDAAVEQMRSAAGLQRRTASLLTVYRPAVAREASQVAVEYFRDRRQKLRILRDLDDSVRHSVDAMHPGAMPPTEVLDASARKDENLRRRGVRLRMIYPLTALQLPQHRRHLRELSEMGTGLRLIDRAPYDVLVYDGRVACLPADPSAPAESPMIVVRGSALVQAQTAMFEDMWLRATPYEQATPDPPGDTELTPQERAVIRLMAAGLSDDQIARRMGVSRRTVQRAVTNLMERLGAASRFEAGLKLAQDPEFARAVRRST